MRLAPSHGSSFYKEGIQNKISEEKACRVKSRGESVQIFQSPLSVESQWMSSTPPLAVSSDTMYAMLSKKKLIRNALL